MNMKTIQRVTRILLNERLRNVWFSRGDSGMVNEILFVVENIMANATFKVHEGRLIRKRRSRRWNTFTTFWSFKKVIHL
jgi:hypothetical protein